MKHKIEIAPNLAIYIDGERVIGSKPHGLFLITETIVSDEDLKRLADRCLEVIADTPQTDLVKDSDGLVKDLVKDTPQTESTGSPIGDYRDGVGAWQTDCGWK